MSDLKTYRVQLDSGIASYAAVTWVLKVLGEYAHVNFEVVNGKADFSIGFGSESNLVLDEQFWKRIQTRDFSADDFSNDLYLKSGDLLGTAFYFLNCLWERDTKRETDHWGRSEFSSSIWAQFGYSAPFNHVNQVFDKIAEIISIEVTPAPIECFLSHDIDAVYGGWKENGFAKLKRFKIGSFLVGLTSHIAGKPEWFNFNAIVSLEKKYKVKSTFFWLVSQSKIMGVGKNADYDIHSKQMKYALDQIEANGFTHGVHKSIDKSSLLTEVNLFGRTITVNRYHYLKFSFEQLVEEMETARLQMDASLGYAEVSGFRNGYTLPFVPFNLSMNRPSTFVEVPLTIMDATFSRYLKLDKEEAIESIVRLLDANKSSALISVLWHNTHFTDGKYEGYLLVYEAILAWLTKNNVRVVGPNDIIQKYL